MEDIRVTMKNKKIHTHMHAGTHRESGKYSYSASNIKQRSEKMPWSTRSFKKLTLGIQASCTSKT